MTTGSLFDRLRLPVIASPLFIISNPELVIAQCTAGIMGALPSLNARPIGQLDEWLAQITEALATWDRRHPDQPSAPFAVNQIVHKSNDRLDQDLALCAKYKVPVVITSLGAREDLNTAVHDWGGVTLHDVIDDRFGRKAIEKGADGLIAVAAGAGGHAGRLSPLALVQELRQWFDGVIALSGSIATGRGVLAAQAMGADLAYVGSLFITAAEANADDRYKQMIVDSNAADIVYSNLFTGVHGNYLRPSIIAAGLDPDALAEGDVSSISFGSGGSSKKKAWRDIWGCGQGIGAVNGIMPAAQHIDRLAREYIAAKAALDANFVRQPDATAPVMIAGERVRTHDEIRRRAALAAEGFRQMGLREGDTVALFLRNDFAFFEAMQGAVLAGAYPVAINWHATAEEAGYILRDSDAKVLVVHTDLLPQIVAGLPEDLRILVVDTPAEIRRAYGIKSAPHNGIHRGWDSWLSRFDPIAQPMTAPRGAVIYTSGTTGRPKGVRRAPGESQAALTATAAIGYGLVPGEDRVVLMNGPMYHAAPNSYGTMAFASGADIVLQPRFDAEEMLQLIERYRVTHMHIVPTMFVRLLRLPEDVKGRYDLSCLRYVAHGAAPCPPDIKRAMIEWWGPVIYEYYGATEAGLISISRPEDALAHPGSVGQALPNVSIKVLDESGDEVPAGTIGDIFIHSEPGATFEYIGRENDRRDDKYLTLGDMGFVDEDGFLFLRDRRRDMIISGGVNIYPAEIEATLQGIVGIRDSAVFGIPDDEFGEAICAHVQVDAGGPDAAAIRASLEQQLSRYKVPRYIEIVEDLPREDSGKIFKRKLREPYWANVGRSI